MYDFYTNLRKWLKRDEDTEQEKILEITATDKSNLSELKNLSEDVEKLKQLWKQTAKARDRKESIAEYYEEYQILKLPIGIELVT